MLKLAQQTLQANALTKCDVVAYDFVRGTDVRGDAGGEKAGEKAEMR